MLKVFDLIQLWIIVLSIERFVFESLKSQQIEREMTMEATAINPTAATFLTAMGCSEKNVGKMPKEIIEQLWQMRESIEKHQKELEAVETVKKQTVTAFKGVFKQSSKNEKLSILLELLHQSECETVESIKKHSMILEIKTLLGEWLENDENGGLRGIASMFCESKFNTGNDHGAGWNECTTYQYLVNIRSNVHNGSLTFLIRLADFLKVNPN